MDEYPTITHPAPHICPFHFPHSSSLTIIPLFPLSFLSFPLLLLFPPLPLSSSLSFPLLTSIPFPLTYQTHSPSCPFPHPSHGLTTTLIHQAHIIAPYQQSPHISSPRPSRIKALLLHLNISSNTRPFVHPAQNSLKLLCTLTA